MRAYACRAEWRAPQSTGRAIRTHTPNSHTPAVAVRLVIRTLATSMTRTGLRSERELVLHHAHQLGDGAFDLVVMDNVVEAELVFGLLLEFALAHAARELVGSAEVRIGVATRILVFRLFRL